jgi:hypothetical protein
MKMSVIYAGKGSLQFAPRLKEMADEIAQDAAAAELMSEIVPLVRFIFW